MANSSLAAIRTKVRRLTRNPSANQLTDADIDEYVNTFIQYDFPEHLRLFSLRRTFTFYTEPFIDTYATNTTDPNDPLYQFEQIYTTVHKPVYIAGVEALFSQSRDEFFAIYPLIESRVDTLLRGTTGGATDFTGTLTGIPMLRNNVLFSSINGNNQGLRLSDNGGGVLVGDVGVGPNTIDYITGAFQISFVTPPAPGEPIWASTYPYTAAKPQSILYFDNQFVLRPVPDNVYRVQMEVYVRPSELLAANADPELEEWWQYIAYGAAIKVLQDRVDMDTVQQLMPEFKKQELLVQRRTIVQQTKERVSTIYTQQVNPQNAYNGYGNFN